MARKRIDPTLPEGLDGDVWQRVMADVRGHVRNAGDWSTLAVESGLSKATISNIAYGITKSPHFSTVYRLMAALGREDLLNDAIKPDKPLTLAAATKMRPAAVKRRIAELEKKRKERQKARKTKTHSKRK